jgi:alkanesulfonate monooxygenase SsuD/methylene tetrahydromethanopterin reductase-like flavin-dependent oxidoreductase (luciferase family)
METGLVTLGDNLPHPLTGERMPAAARFRQIIELGVLAEELGFTSFHVGEHHFSDYILSSPTPLLAAVAERTKQLRLSTAVSLLPHHDPVRVAEDYATVDVVSGGRVELIAGRGVYKRHHALFGHQPERSGELLSEAVTLLRRLWAEEDVHWEGTLRPPLTGVTVHPRPVQAPHPPLWLSASSEESVDRAIELGCPITIPTVSTGVAGAPRIAARYRAGWAAAGRDPAGCRVALHLHCHVGVGTTAEAVDAWRPYQHGYLSWVLRDVVGTDGTLPPHFAALGEPGAQAVVGSVEDVAADIAGRIRDCGGVDRLLVQMDQGAYPPELVVATVTRFARDVLPRVREALGASA